MKHTCYCISTIIVGYSPSDLNTDERTGRERWFSCKMQLFKSDCWIKTDFWKHCWFYHHSILLFKKHYSPWNYIFATSITQKVFIIMASCQKLSISVMSLISISARTFKKQVLYSGKVNQMTIVVRSILTITYIYILQTQYRKYVYCSTYQRSAMHSYYFARAV
jgi:hypothetical protein